MILGEATPPPPGFVALCEASPEACSNTVSSADELSDIRKWAGQARWAQTFAQAGIAVASEPARPNLIPNTLSVSATEDVGRAIREARAVAKAAARKAQARDAAVGAAKPGRATKPRQVKPRIEPPAQRSSEAAIAAADVDLRQLENINRRVNRAIRRSADEDTFGAADVWAVPSGPRARGDCEDYALAKRRALVEAGIDPAQLSLAVVRTHRGEVHAVLLVATGAGEYVLDNLSPWVVRWDEAPYQWLERQVPGAPLSWVRLDRGQAA